MSLPFPIPPVLRSWLGRQVIRELDPEMTPPDPTLVALVKRVLYALDECFPAWTTNQTTQILDYLYRRCELSSFLYLPKACERSLGATPPLTPAPVPPVGPPILTLRSFTSSSPLNLLGSPVSGLTLSWTYNRPVDTQTLNGKALPPSARSLVLSGSYSSSQPYTLRATLGGQIVSGTTPLSFVNQVLVGVGLPELTDLTQLTPLPLAFPESRNTPFQFQASRSQKGYLAFPLRLGANPQDPSLPQARYTVGAFEGGFLERVLSYTNPAGYTEDYVLAETTNTNLGLVKGSIS